MNPAVLARLVKLAGIGKYEETRTREPPVEGHMAAHDDEGSSRLASYSRPVTVGYNSTTTEYRPVLFRAGLHSYPRGSEATLGRASRCLSSISKRSWAAGGLTSLKAALPNLRNAVGLIASRPL